MEDGKTVKLAKVSIRETWEQLEAIVDAGIAIMASEKYSLSHIS